MLENWRSEHGRSARSDDVPTGTRPRAAGGFPSLEGGGRGVGDSDAFEACGVERMTVRTELRPYCSESWFTAEGARKKKRRLEKAGLPNFKNWRFITLTVADREIGPREAYELGKDRLRRFNTKFRKAIGRKFAWCWKLETHEDGYAHWHLLLEYKKRIPQEMLGEVEKWWGLGRVNIRRVNGRDINYVFKYVAKGIEEIPDWIAHYRGRIRVFQTSPGFYTNRTQRVAKHAEPKSCLVRVDLITRQGWDGRKAIAESKMLNGEIHTRVFKIPKPFSVLLQEQVIQAIHWRQQLAAPGSVFISQLQLEKLKHEHKRYTGLAILPPQITAN